LAPLQEWSKRHVLKLAMAIVVAEFLGACATIPNVTLSYNRSKWSSVATVTQTIGCNAAKTRVVVLNTPSVTTTYSSNVDEPPFTIGIKELEGGLGGLADSEMSITFTDDGRLKSINQSTMGQGEAIVKSAVALAGAVALFYVKPAPPDRTLEECNTIETWGAGKPITLSYKAPITTPGTDVAFEAASESKELYALIRNQLPTLKATVSGVSDSKNGPIYDGPRSGTSESVVLLELQKMGSVSVTIKANTDTIGTARIVIPKDDTYKLPIPKAALFGKQTFALTLAESGAVTSVGYGKTTGAASALNALGAIAGAETQITAAKAAELKAQADVIAQQQRLVLCETKPDQCK
jgi:hypothetical protein